MSPAGEGEGRSRTPDRRTYADRADHHKRQARARHRAVERLKAQHRDEDERDLAEERARPDA